MRTHSISPSKWRTNWYNFTPFVMDTHGNHAARGQACRHALLSPSIDIFVELLRRLVRVFSSLFLLFFCWYCAIRAWNAQTDVFMMKRNATRLVGLCSPCPAIEFAKSTPADSLERKGIKLFIVRLLTCAGVGNYDEGGAHTHKRVYLAIFDASSIPAVSAT